jgi:hypothetical protein
MVSPLGVGISEIAKFLANLIVDLHRKFQGLTGIFEK